MINASASASSSFSAPIACVRCDEPRGMVVRAVRPMELSIDNLKRMWELSRKYNTLFNEEIRGDFRKFLEVFLRQLPDGSVECNGLFWVIDDFIGMFYMTEIVPDTDANVHYTFFDGRHKGRVELVKEVIRYAFRHYNFRRLSVEVALYATHGVMNFVEEVGFKNEGTKRKAIWYKGDWFDVNIFGILKEEALGGSQDT